MNERQPQLGSHESRTEHTADIFVRLRERIEEMRSGDRGKVDPEALAKKLAQRTQKSFGAKGRVHFNVGGSQAIEDSIKLS